MTMVLDILEMYLKARHYSYERIDGNVKSLERQHRIDRFDTREPYIFRGF